MKQQSITLNLKRVAYATFHWRNRKGSINRNSVPCLGEYINGVWVHNKDLESPAHPHLDYPHETLLERAKRLDIIDTWTPVFTAYFTKYDKIVIEGERAEALWKCWNAMQFGKKK